MVVKNPESKFLKVVCEKCKNEQIIFEKATRKISCLICQEPLAEPKGGKLKLKARILEVLD